MSYIGIYAGRLVKLNSDGTVTAEGGDMIELDEEIAEELAGIEEEIEELKERKKERLAEIKARQDAYKAALYRSRVWVRHLYPVVSKMDSEAIQGAIRAFLEEVSKGE